MYYELYRNGKLVGTLNPTDKKMLERFKRVFEVKEWVPKEEPEKARVAKRGAT